MTEHPDRLERTLELLLYAPIGVGLFLKDTAPTFVNMFVSRGRAEVDRRQDEVQQRVTTARSLGQVALAFGPPVVRKRVEKTVAGALHRVEGVFGTPSSEPAPDTSPADVSGSPTVPEPAPWTPPATAGPRTGSTPAATEEPQSNGRGEGERPNSAGLPIPGYDALSASQVVARLTGLAPEELDAVHAYEASHRKRRTILGKIEQLAG
jgi:hypothetical protein